MADNDLPSFDPNSPSEDVLPAFNPDAPSEDVKPKGASSGNWFVDMGHEMGSEFSEGMATAKKGLEAPKPGVGGAIENLKNTAMAPLGLMRAAASPAYGPAKSLVGHLMAKGEHYVGENWVNPALEAAGFKAQHPDEDQMYQTGKQDFDLAMSAARPAGMPIKGPVGPAVTSTGPGGAQITTQPRAWGWHGPQNVPPAPVNNDPFGVLQTEGERTGDMIARQREQAAGRGQAGDAANSAFHDFMNMQRQPDLEAAHQDVSGQLNTTGNPGQPILAENPQEAAQYAQTAVQRAFAQSKQFVRNSYEAAKAAGGEIHANVFRNIADDIGTALSDPSNPVYVDDKTPTASNMMRYIRENIANLRIPNAAPPPPGTGMAMPGQPNIVGVNLEGVDQWRKSLSMLRGDAIKAAGTNPSDDRAASAIMKAFDDRINAAVNTPGEFNGNPNAVQAWNDARAAHSQHMQLFGNDPVGKKIQSIIGNSRFGVDPAGLNTVSDYIFGGGAKPTEMNLNVARRIRNIVGVNSPEWSALRQGLFERNTSNAQGLLGHGQTAKNLSELVDGKGSDMAGVMYTPDQQAMLRAYANMHRTLQVPKMAANWPNTAGGMRPFFNMVGEKITGLIGSTIGTALGGHPFWGYATGRAIGKGFERLADASRAREIRAQMPILSQQFQQWQQAVNAQTRISSPANAARVSFTMNNLIASLGRFGVNHQAALQLLTQGPQSTGPANAEGDGRLRVGPPEKASGGRIQGFEAGGDPVADDDTQNAPAAPLDPIQPGERLPVSPYRGEDLPDVGSAPFLANTQISPGFPAANNFVNRASEDAAQFLTDRPGKPHQQLWPERMVRSGATLAHDILTGDAQYIPGLRREDVTDIPPPSGVIQAEPNDEVIERAQDMAATGDLIGGLFAGKDVAGGETLGAGPFLRPALKHEGKIYKAPMGGQHLDALPPKLQDDFQRQALSGEDISNYQFGYMNHKGQFLSREAALDYGIKEGLIDPRDARYGTLTSTMFSDTSKPGAAMSAIERGGLNEGAGAAADVSGGAGRGATSLEEAQAAAERHAGTEGPLPNLPTKGMKIGDDYFVPGPIGRIRDIAADYMRTRNPEEHSLPFPDQYHPIDPERSKAIAQAFDTMEHAPNDPRVKASYQAMINETRDQFQHLMKSGLKVDPISPDMADPYALNPRLAAKDVAENNHLWFFPTDQGFGTSAQTGIDMAAHPMMQPSGLTLGGRPLLNNDLFRVVHDYFGHLKEGYGFRAAGEDNAWRSHAAMYSDQARPAMTSETRGQNSWVNYGPHGEANRKASAADTVYSDQKAGLLPDWTMTENYPGKVLKSDTSESGAALSAAERAAPFYSALDHTIAAAKQSKMSGEQWANWLRNQPGVKQEELEHTGIDNWLRGQKGPVTKDQVHDFFNSNRTEIGETVKGQMPKWYNDLDQKQGAIVHDQFELLNGRPPHDLPEIQDWYENIAAKSHAGYETALTHKLGATSYEQWQLPGGDNYREHLLTLPSEEPKFALYRGETRLSDRDFKTAQEARDYARRSGGFDGASVRQSNETPDTYKSSHWEEPNVLAHARTNDREMTVDGFALRNRRSGNTSQTFPTKEAAEKYRDENFPAAHHQNLDVVSAKGATKPTFHIEELQSDWHQAGRKNGYRGDNVNVNPEEAAKKAYENMGNNSFGPWDQMNDMQKDIFRNYAESQAKDSKAVPNAPFKTSWPELMLKRMIQKAVEEGKDRISWTPGEAQADRYSLSNHFKAINVVKSNSGERAWHPIDKNGQTKGFFITDADGKVTKANALWGDIKGKNVDEVLGKDVAKKGMESDQRETKLEGMDLKFGGEGMKGFYDDMMPKIAEKIGKKYGVKVREGTVPSKPFDYSNVSPDTARRLGNRQNPPQKVWYFDIPPKMKDDVMSKGFSLFSDTSKPGAALAGAERPALFNPNTGLPIQGKAFTKASKATLNEINAGPKGAGPLDLSSQSQIPGTTQANLDRYVPPRGVSARLKEALENPAVVKGISNSISAGKKMGADKWYHTEPIRQAFINELGPEKGAAEFGRFMDHVAATSPRSDVSTNIRNASFQYLHAMHGEPLPAKLPYPFGHVAQKLHKQNFNTLTQARPGDLSAGALQHAGTAWDIYRNPKPASFSENLRGNLQPVTVDTHAFRNIGMRTGDPRFLETQIQMPYKGGGGPDSQAARFGEIKGKIVTYRPQQLVKEGRLTMEEAKQIPAFWSAMPKENEYAAAEQLYQQLAKNHRIPPADAQAAAWSGAGGLTGLASPASKTFSELFNERVLYTAKMRGETPIDTLRSFIRGEQPLFSDVALPGSAANATHEDKKKVGWPAKQKKAGNEVDVPARAAGGRVIASNIDHTPSEAQRRAGNYAKDHVRIQGLDLTIENAKGKERSGVGKNGKKWSVKMPAHYGYVKKTEGADGDHVDVYLGPHTASKHVFVVNQVDADSKKFDEHKCILGAGTLAQAVSLYEKGFSDGKGLQRVGSIVPTTMDIFKHWLKHGDTSKPFRHSATCGEKMFRGVRVEEQV